MSLFVRAGECLHACVGTWCARAGVYTGMVLLANPPIQADINAIDCNWAVMCGI